MLKSSEICMKWQCKNCKKYLECFEDENYSNNSSKNKHKINKRRKKKFNKKLKSFDPKYKNGNS